MSEDTNKLEELSAKLDQLLAMHNSVSTEIDSLRVEIIRLKVAQNPKTQIAEDEIVQDDSVSKDDLIIETKSDEYLESELVTSEVEENADIESVIAPEDSTTAPEIGAPETNYFKIRDQRKITSEPEEIPTKKFDIEKLIGENLINKIGILVLIIGVAIGAKYSIENELISPLGRIILGYVVGIILLGLGMWLKKKYLNFSAVLVSGAMAILYFITFFAFNFYQLIGQEVAFGLMVIFTIFTVLAALNYDKEIIAHLGLVGAVGVPFLLSDESGNVLFLFSYLAMINLGIAFISLRKNWKLLFYSSFVLTWMIYFSWIVLGYKEAEHFALALGFLTLFFILFYVIFMAYKFLNLEKYGIGDVIVLLLNALIFFAIGYNLLEGHDIGGQMLGVFAVGNAFIHFVAATIINKRKLADRNIFYLVVGLVLVCLTLAIPIQLDGHWVTIMWSLEAVVLFLIGRSKQVAFYEYISFALIGIAGLSLIENWNENYYSIRLLGYYGDFDDPKFAMFFNTNFLTSIIACISLGAILWMHQKENWRAISKINKKLLEVLDYVLPVALFVSIYFAFRLEIVHYFAHQYADSAVELNNSKKFNDNIGHYTNVWLFNYTLLYATIVSVLIYKWIKSNYANWAMIIVNVLAIIGFLMGGLYELSELRVNYLNQYNSEYFAIDNSFIWIRYVSILLVAGLVGATYYLLKKVNRDYKIYALAETLFYLVVLWLSTSELIQWLDFTERSETYGLALSIFWGIFSVIIIAFGIWKKKKHLRILGIALFGITLVKLFFYDLSYLTTIAKTIVMISLGALLLLTSFLYNKYTIEDEEEI